MKEKFNKFLEENYSNLTGISIGRPIFDGEINNDHEINIPIKMLTRHGLVTGSTGTGKSRVIQLIIEKLNEEDISVFLSDIKGDMSGFCVEGNAEKVAKRAKKLHYEFSPKKFKTNYWGSGDGLIKFRVSLDDIDFIILSKLLELNATQESHLGAVYRFAKEKNITIQNLKDLSDVLSYLIKNQ